MRGALRRLLALFLLVVLSPLMGIIAIVVFFDSPDSIIFRKISFGKHQKPFAVYKFRTLHDSVCPTLNVSRGDPRITKSGRWLRASHLDELPQLWNIVRGEMGFIGPRPCSVELVPIYKSLLHWRYRNRFSQLPGLTGLAQTSLLKNEDMRQLVALEEYYRWHGNVCLDMRILAKTFWQVIRFASY